jgi:hypothetical protein
MKFLCVPCDQPMKLIETRPPDRGSLTIVYSCDACGYEMAMLTNAYETQMVQSLGVRIGPAGGEKPGEKSASASACPFAASLGGGATTTEQAPAPGVAWTSGAEERLRNIPEFVRPMARTGIESFARERGYARVDEQVMEEARHHFGM